MAEKWAAYNEAVSRNGGISPLKGQCDFGGFVSRASLSEAATA